MDKKAIRLLVFAFFLAVGVSGVLSAETFEYKFATGNKYRIISVVNEDVYIDRVFYSRVRILNRVTVEITDGEGAIAQHNAVFSTSEQSVEGDNTFQLSREYTSTFGRDRLGHITIGSEYYMPVVRNVPVFPDRDIKEGESWTAAGYEMHDFRDSFGIVEPYRIPFDAHYVFLGYREWKGQSYPVFSVSYRIFYEPPPVTGRIWPRRILGASDQLIYWDLETGQAVAYDESFRMIFELSDGRTVEYRGRAEAEIIEAEIMKKEDIAQDIADELERLGITDASVRIDEEGITINLENIQFLPNSAILQEGEKAKLDKIGEILKKFSDRDILVSGHTAMAGTAAARLQTSKDRAGAVANYLVSKGVRNSSQVVVRGYGAERPLADNNTPEGMAKNRRVEITLLEN
ncbi:MAG: OmpA family protein [Treponema sp.]|nr:OmpA family protein [Treponema sp.]